MEVSGQFHVSAALPPGKEPLVPTGREAGWAPESSVLNVVEKNREITGRGRQNSSLKNKTSE
jgi:hypothetical protein